MGLCAQLVVGSVRFLLYEVNAHPHSQGTSDSHITFLRGIRSEKVDENVIKLLVGHEKEFTMKHYGGDPFSTKRLFKDVSKVNYKGIKWDDLKIV